MLMAALSSLGYEARLGILQAGYYGLPQNRWRVFIYCLSFWAGPAFLSTAKVSIPKNYNIWRLGLQGECC